MLVAPHRMLPQSRLEFASTDRLFLPMLLSKNCEYGLRAMLYLGSLQKAREEGGEGTSASDAGDDAPSPPGDYVSISTISDDLDIGLSLLTNVLQELNAAGLLTSKRGRGGGVALTRPPKDTNLYDIIVALEGPELFEQCILGLPGCGDAEPCPIHEHWTRERDRLKATLQGTTLAEVPDVRLTPFLKNAAEEEKGG